MAKTTVLFNIGSGPSTVVGPSAVYVRAVAAFPSGTKVILPGPGPVVLDDAGMGSAQLDSGYVWEFTVKVPDYTEGPIYKYVPASASPLQYADLVPVPEPPADPSGVPAWVEAVLAAADEVLAQYELIQQFVEDLPNMVGVELAVQIPLILASQPSYEAMAQVAVDARVAALPVDRVDKHGDLANSWHTWPDFVVEPVQKRYHVSGSTRGGAVKAVWFDRRSKTKGEKIISVENVRADDHYTQAFYLPSKRQGFIGGSLHGERSYWSVHKTATSGSIEILEPEIRIPSNNTTGTRDASYGAFVAPRPTNLDLIMMVGRVNLEQYLLRSTDYGVTWQPPIRLLNRQYFAIRRDGPGVNHCLAITHPTQGTVQCHYFRFSAGAGLPTKADGTSVVSDAFAGQTIYGYAGDAETNYIDISKCDLVRQAPTGESQRVLDTALNGRRILMCIYPDKANMAAGGTYKVMVRQGSDSINSWSEETLVASGASFYPASGYVGGACFASDGSVLLIRESGGIWTLERWKRTAPGTFQPGTWAYHSTLYTAPAGTAAMGRPRSAVNCDDWTIEPGVVTWNLYHTFNTADFHDQLGDQMFLEFTI